MTGHGARRIVAWIAVLLLAIVALLVAAPPAVLLAGSGIAADLTPAGVQSAIDNLPCPQASEYDTHLVRGPPTPYLPV